MEIAELQKLLKKALLINSEVKNKILTSYCSLDTQSQNTILESIHSSIELQDLLLKSAQKKEKDFVWILQQKLHMIQKDIYLESEKIDIQEESDSILSNWP